VDGLCRAGRPGAASYNQLLRNQRVKTASFDLFSSLSQAR
jgi:hypothetical protein